MPRGIGEQAIVAVYLSQLVVQMPVFTARPNTPIGNKQQRSSMISNTAAPIPKIIIFVVRSAVKNVFILARG